jgi:hypothetical protein
MSAESFNGGTRDNGLRCAGYRPVADLDPRVADAMLVTLRTHGIAAYAAPTPAAAGAYGELHLPSVPTDRLWVDGEQVDRARDLLTGETGEAGQTGGPSGADEHAGPPSVDFDAAWQQVLTSLRSPSVREPEPRWPERENVGTEELDVEAATGGNLGSSYDPADEDHFVPPQPPPLPRLRSVTLAAAAAIGLGLFVLVVNLDGGTFRVPAFVAIIGGAISLVWNMRQGPPTDSGWDDGAVV